MVLSAIQAISSSSLLQLTRRQMPAPLLQILQLYVPRQFSRVMADSYCHIDMFEQQQGKVLKQSHLCCSNAVGHLVRSLSQEELCDESRKHQSPDSKKDS